ncbi:hypothetical protein [Planctomicrobium sp. SH664]|uniref:hypothetical protein n=1 Tax=Planctomicrobium sp. SH664 TaxID=3448125 RepID=UPI003F5B0254
MSRFVIAFQFLSGLLLAGGLVGCAEQGPNLAPVKGKVTFNGKPLPMGTVIFTPNQDGPYATGEIAEDGTFVMTTFKPGDGALVGSHSVMINAVDGSNPEAPPKAIIPMKYLNQMSGLKATVEPNIENVVEFELGGK